MTAETFDPGRAAFDFIDAIEHTSERQQVVERFDGELAKYGFHAWLITGLPATDDCIEPLMLLNGWPEGWMRLYTSHKFVRNDPVVEHCFRSTAPFEWHQAPFDPIRSPKAKLVMDRACDFRMLKGLCVPVHTAEGFQAVITMAGEHVELAGHARPALHLMALYAYAKAVDLASPLNPNRQFVLTEREREVLRWTAAGKTAWEISQILGIAEATVTAHIKSAAVKFDAPNRTATVVKAIRRGEIAL
jgi:LuxR family quorum sensing-dependent transcriptional regulator